MPILKLIDSDLGQKQLEFNNDDCNTIPNGICVRDGINGTYLNKIPKIRNEYYAIMYDSIKNVGFLFTLDDEFINKYRYNNILTINDVLNIMTDLEKIKKDYINDRNSSCCYGPYKTLTHKFIDNELIIIFDNRYIRNHKFTIDKVNYLIDILHNLYLLYGN